MNWLDSPLPYYSLLAAGFGLCLYLFLSLKGEIWALEKRRKADVETLTAEVHRLRGAFQELLDDVKIGTEPPPAVPDKPASFSSMNISRRTQVLRMYRRGERSEQIAAALGIPAGEVDLLLKIHRTVIGKL